MEISKEQRALYFERKCREAGYRDWGKTQNLARDLGVSHGQVSNWQSGALPRGHDEIWRVAEHLNIDIMEWIYGVEHKSDVLDEKKLAACLRLLKAVERGDDAEMTPSQFARLTLLAYKDEVSGTAMLAKLGSEISNIESERENDGVVVNGL